MKRGEKDDVKIILKRYFSFDNEWSEARKKVIEHMGWDKNITASKASEMLTPDDLINIWNRYGEYKELNFYGRF